MVAEERFMIHLNDVNKVNVNLIGRKAANLGILIQNKFNVPIGYVISTDAYKLFLEYNNLEKIIQNILSEMNSDDLNLIASSSKKIRNIILESELPEEVISEIHSKFQNLEPYPLAIRSSATSEDLPTASFAGQYDSYLNINGVKDTINHIKQCYSSLWTTRAISYRIKNQIPHKNLKLAVIIQKLISAKSAGVLFTTNPITSDESQLIIESNYGLGESIVSGKITPDQFIIQKESKRKFLFKIIDKRIGNKKFSIHPKSLDKGSGIDVFDLSDQLNEKPSLSDKQIISLSKIGIQIENTFGKIPQDIEWAIDNNNNIFILQTRPVTSKKSLELEGLPIYSRGYADDYWNDDTTPLFFDLLGDQITKVVNIELNSIMGYKSIDKQLLKLYKGHVYFNLDVLKSKVEYEIPTFVRNEDVLNYFPEGYGSYGKETMKKLPFRLLRRIFSELRVKFHDPDGAMSKTAMKYEQWTQEIFDPYCEEFDSKLRDLLNTDDLKALFDLWKEFNKVMISHFRLIRYGIPVHNIGMNLMTQYLLTRFFGKEESQNIFPILISGLDHKLTETNHRIHQLASLILSSSHLKSLFREKKSDEIYQIIKTEKNPDVIRFLNQFEDFLQKFGDRGFTREIYYPRWKESPDLVFDILKSLTSENWDQNHDIKSKMLHKQEIVERSVEKRLRSKIFGPLIWKLFSGILKNSRKYIIFRENQRFNLDKWITRNRELFLEVGRILVKREILQNRNEIFFLYKKEIRKIIFDEYNLSEMSQLSKLTRDRMNEFLKYENVIPPKFLLGSNEFDDLLEFDENSNQFRGIPASHGIITAPIRILHDISFIPTIQAGEILVVPRTDPGWTPVFAKIGGLITETGGVLSHGAVVSREYGIPAVTNIPNACKIFKTGQLVTINGFNGSVFLKN